LAGLRSMGDESTFFAARCVSDGVRLDCRAFDECREFEVGFGAAFGEAEVRCGHTKALAVVTAEVVKPDVARPSEGQVSFHVELGTASSAATDVTRLRARASALANHVERILAGSRAIDGEALCIRSGEQVWSVRCEVHALEDRGNFRDVAVLAALAGLMHYRHSCVEFADGEATVIAPDLRPPVTMSVHHLPIPASFAILAGSFVLDPSVEEEEASDGLLCIAATKFGEICGIDKPGGSTIKINALTRLLFTAQQHACNVTALLRAALEADDQVRRKARKRGRPRDWGCDVPVTEPVATTCTLPPIAVEPVVGWPRGEALGWSPVGLDLFSEVGARAVAAAAVSAPLVAPASSMPAPSSASAPHPARSAPAPAPAPVSAVPTVPEVTVALEAIHLDEDDDLSSAVKKKRRTKK